MGDSLIAHSSGRGLREHSLLCEAPCPWLDSVDPAPLRGALCTAGRVRILGSSRFISLLHSCSVPGRLARGRRRWRASSRGRSRWSRAARRATPLPSRYRPGRRAWRRRCRSSTTATGATVCSGWGGRWGGCLRFTGVPRHPLRMAPAVRLATTPMIGSVSTVSAWWR